MCLNAANIASSARKTEETVGESPATILRIWWHCRLITRREWAEAIKALSNNK